MIRPDEINVERSGDARRLRSEDLEEPPSDLYLAARSLFSKAPCVQGMHLGQPVAQSGNWKEMGISRRFRFPSGLKCSRLMRETMALQSPGLRSGIHVGSDDEG